MIYELDHAGPKALENLHNRRMTRKAKRAAVAAERETYPAYGRAGLVHVTVPVDQE